MAPEETERHEKDHMVSSKQVTELRKHPRVTTTELGRLYGRVRTAAPATVRASGHSLAATTRDISLGGVFMVTDARFREGTAIEVVLMLPKELGLPASEVVCCHGKIVRTEIMEGQYGIAAKIERIPAVPQADLLIG
jgi:hypothetical protein